MCVNNSTYMQAQRKVSNTFFLLSEESRNRKSRNRIVRGWFNHYLCNVDKLGENLSSQLSSRPAQHHQLNPLGDTIAQGNGTFHHGDVLHAAAANVILIVCKLTERT